MNTYIVTSGNQIVPRSDLSWTLLERGLTIMRLRNQTIGIYKLFACIRIHDR